MSDDSKRRSGRSSRYLNGGSNALMRRAAGARENLEQNGGWSRSALIKMDAKFVAAMKRAFRLGRENRASASREQRAVAGDRDRLSMAS